ncbi:hypothetical protein [Deefgea sp. CFH1-16]|uniref:hypothetical protein n=1 Tax=Deefgea sp. CFH1-16 TaxID=2675457 RepID=UPI001FFD3A75|nr:hypothetical protein [Deefgea sp. CFH1-16]
MTIDMSQFIAVFFDEAAEHLASLEALLLKLDVENPDPEALNAIFFVLRTPLKVALLHLDLMT